MKKRKCLSLLLSLAMTAGLSVPVFANDLDGKLVVLHTNDMHGYYSASETSVGIAGVAGLKDYYEEQGADVILLDAGDFSQGTTLVNHENGMKAAEYLTAADYDVVSLGNHEFDFGFDALLDIVATLKAGGVTVLDANVLEKGTTKPYFGDNIAVDMDGFKVGIFGLDTAEAQTKASPSSVAKLSFLDKEEMFVCAQAQVDQLKAQGCDYIIALTHLGVDEESAGRRSTELAEAVTGIDLIVDGHSHTAMDGGQMVGDTMIVSTGSYLENVGTVIVDKATGEETAKLISAADYAANYGKYDEVLAGMVAADQEEVDAYYAGVFATTEVDLNGEKDPGVRTEETNLGDFTADAYLYAGRKYAQEQNLGITVDIAISNGGGIRASVPKGEISMNTLYTVFPYGNTLALVTITGEQLLEVLEASTFCTPTAIGGFPQIAGAEFTVNTAVEYTNGEQYPDSTYYAPADPGSRVTITSVGGKAFDPKANYTVVVNSFQAEGGDTYYVLTQGSYMQDTGVIDAEALIDYVNSMDGVIGQEYAQPQGRIQIVAEAVEEPATEPVEEPAVEPAESEQTTEVVPEEEETPDVMIYTVKAGDSLWRIAEKILGNGNFWSRIYEANRSVIKDPSLIYIGQELKLP
ncbi:5'-nucleotidase C-terminal domain-containing protein [Anaerotignum lactatifermentans]|uniref:5'-nucleotidase C-terminal domain-containing protein n=1 Tax=Anaerotignum lactatifermentans TaxID=160404 RepID=A0ABS2G6B3_9FIRM|nr:5'-nucleotidase C-terminal domain-containing protein [Anaerotignum lactatifermentans]MBM6828838.1 5'-nucleotidase C-terminal domain-containing protein [Anaerotignum lactatifermentans]MBM6876989.1 5'-nucleotidase C-terminal domain-containing protein [Anaerotignum lactatifermentans]MBM6950547.1 5'-nucleotidase C-terminal domain-containing protein [Anaerotignum lactatifermentans]